MAAAVRQEGCTLASKRPAEGMRWALLGHERPVILDRLVRAEETSWSCVVTRGAMRLPCLDSGGWLRKLAGDGVAGLLVGPCILFGLFGMRLGRHHAATFPLPFSSMLPVYKVVGSRCALSPREQRHCSVPCILFCRSRHETNARAMPTSSTCENGSRSAHVICEAA